MNKAIFTDQLRPSAASVEATNVSRRFGEFQALNGVDIYVEPGEIVGIIGPNGAGKTTLLRACEGIEKIDGGRILALGVDLAVERNAVKGRLGTVIQRPKFSGYASVRETISLFRSFKKPNVDPETLAESLGLVPKLDTRISKLSGGERQRLGVLLGLMGGNEIILLDEPTSELDPQARRVVWQLIGTVARDFGSAVLMTTHQMEEAELLCDRIYIFDHGRIIASGSPSEVIFEHCRTISVVLMIRSDAAGELEARFPDLETARHGQFVKCRKKVATVDEGQQMMLSLLDAFGVHILEIALKRPNLEDVFIELTGAGLRS